MTVQMINRIQVLDPMFVVVTDDSGIDEVVETEHKGQYYGYKVYHVPETNTTIPREYRGYWKCNMMWGDMCGDMEQEALVRVLHKEIIVPRNIWEEILDGT